MHTEETIDIKKVLNVLFEKKITILAFILVSSVFSILIALNLPNYYKSEALLEAVSSSSGNSVGDIGGLGSLASMAGVDIGGPGGGKEAELAIAMTTSRDFFNMIIEEYEFILPALMASKSFNTESQSIHFDEDKYNKVSGQWQEHSSFLRVFKKPTKEQAYRHFISKVFKVSRNNKTGYLKMTVEHKSPVFSNRLLNIIIMEVNQKSRQKALDESSKSLLFLREEASLNKVSLINEAISGLIQSQLQTQMMAKVHEDYLLKIIDSPFVPEKKSKPQRAIICIIGVLIGFFLSLLYILFTSFFVKKN